METYNVFVTDNGKIMKSTDGLISIDRYGVWQKSTKERNYKAEVIETSNDLNYLLEKYELKLENVFKIK